MYVADIVLVTDSGMELQTMPEEVLAFMMSWRMKFNSKKGKSMVVGMRECRRLVKRYWKR